MKKSELAFHDAYAEFHAKIHHYLERMVAAGFVVLVGIFALIMMSRMQRVCCGPE